MKKYLLLAALSAVATATPAFAQYSARPAPYSSQGGYLPQQLIDRLAARIETSIRSGIISRFDAQRLRGEADRLRRMEYQYRLNGMTGWERSDLARRIDALRNNLFAAERGYGNDVRSLDRAYDRGDRLDDGGDIFTDFDRNNDGFDDRDLDHDGRWDDDRSPYRDTRQWDSDEPEEEFTPLLQPDADNRLDYDEPGNLDEGPADADYEELGVGDRAPADLGPVPSYLRSRYRDGSGLTYRYRDGAVFQIDANTGIIRWIGEIPE